MKCYGLCSDAPSQIPSLTKRRTSSRIRSAVVTEGPVTGWSRGAAKTDRPRNTRFGQLHDVKLPQFAYACQRGHWKDRCCQARSRRLAHGGQTVDVGNDVELKTDTRETRINQAAQSVRWTRQHKRKPRGLTHRHGLFAYRSGLNDQKQTLVEQGLDDQSGCRRIPEQDCQIEPMSRREFVQIAGQAFKKLRPDPGMTIENCGEQRESQDRGDTGWQTYRNTTGHRRLSRDIRDGGLHLTQDGPRMTVKSIPSFSCLHTARRSCQQLSFERSF